jgi:hypothetical protein
MIHRVTLEGAVCVDGIRSYNFTAEVPQVLEALEELHQSEIIKLKNDALANRTKDFELIQCYVREVTRLNLLYRPWWKKVLGRAN